MGIKADEWDDTLGRTGNKPTTTEQHKYKGYIQKFEEDLDKLKTASQGDAASLFCCILIVLCTDITTNLFARNRMGWTNHKFIWNYSSRQWRYKQGSALMLYNFHGSTPEHTRIILLIKKQWNLRA